jgi:hypothetical protein
VATVKALATEGPGAFNDDTEEAEADDTRTHTASEPATVHAGGMNDRDWETLGQIPEFLRRT